MGGVNCKTRNSDTNSLPCDETDSETIVNSNSQFSLTCDPTHPLPLNNGISNDNNPPSFNRSSVEYTMTNQNVVIHTPIAKSMVSNSEDYEKKEKTAPTPIPSSIHRNKSIKKGAKTRKMPLEVIDEINGEVINKTRNEYNIMVNPNQMYKYCKTKGMNYALNGLYKKPSYKDIGKKKKSWRDLNITEILPKEMLYIKNDIFILQAEFLIFSKDNDIKRIAANYKYLILTRSELRIYRSKEAMLYMKNPLQRISLFNISQCDVITEKKIKEEYKNVKQLCKFNFCVQYITINGMKIEADEKMNESKEVKNIYKEVNVNGGESEEEAEEEESMKIIKGKKMKLIKEEDNSESSIKRKNDNVYDNNSYLIIFSSNDEELVNRWICVVNYFLGR